MQLLDGNFYPASFAKTFSTEPFIDHDGQSILVSSLAGAWPALDTFWGQIGDLTREHLIGQDIIDQLITGTETALQMSERLT